MRWIWILMLMGCGLVDSIEGERVPKESTKEVTENVVEEKSTRLMVVGEPLTGCVAEGEDYPAIPIDITDETGEGVSGVDVKVRPMNGSIKGIPFETPAIFQTDEKGRVLVVLTAGQVLEGYDDWVRIEISALDLEPMEKEFTVTKPHFLHPISAEVQYGFETYTYFAFEAEVFGACYQRLPDVDIVIDHRASNSGCQYFPDTEATWDYLATTTSLSDGWISFYRELRVALQWPVPLWNYIRMRFLDAEPIIFGATGAACMPQ